MAPRSHGKDNLDLVNNLKENGVVKSEAVANAMLAVDRGHYSDENPYEDSPQPIGYGATISAPHVHALALESLKDQLAPGKKALDIGSGTGYLTACMAIMVGPSGTAVGIEHIPQLVEKSIANVRRGNPDLLESGCVKFYGGDGRLGYAAEAPYDAIHVGAAAATIPQKLIDQLAVGGRLVLPVGAEHHMQVFQQVDKHTDGSVTVQDLMGVIYVPLTDRSHQWPGGCKTITHFDQQSAKIE